MDFELIQDCNKELASSDFGDVGVDAAAAAGQGRRIDGLEW